MKTLLFLLSPALLIILVACGLRTGNQEEPRELRTLSETVAGDGVEHVTAELSMGVGKLMITGGADQLMEADFEYNQDQWKPTVDFQQNGPRGELTIDQPDLVEEFDLNFGDDQRSEWRVRLNDDVPLALACNVGAGETELDLRGLLLERVDIDAGVGEHTIILTDTSLPELTVDAGVGEVSIDLGGKWTNNLRAEIDGGIGELNLTVPADVGVQIDVSGGLGSVDVPSDYTQDGSTYTNAAYATAEYRLDFDVDAGMGSVEVIVAE